MQGQQGKMETRCATRGDTGSRRDTLPCTFVHRVVLRHRPQRFASPENILHDRHSNDI
jgi:hypothetical protein